MLPRGKWKLSMMSQMGMKEALPLAIKTRKQEPIVHRAPVDGLQPMVQPVVPAMAAVVATDDGLRQEMRQVVGLIKNLSLNLLSNVGNVQGHGRLANQPGNDGGQKNGRRWRNVPT